MTGVVDDYGRALVRVTVVHPTTGARTELDAWIDTGFTGSLMLPAEQIAHLGLPPVTPIPAGLADGSRTMFDTYACQVDWFGRVRAVDAMAGTGRFALIGVALIEDHVLTIDYPRRGVTLVQTALPSPP